MQQMPKLLRVKEAAQVAGVSYWTMWRLVKSGALPVVRYTPRGVIMIREDTLSAFLQV